MKFRTRLALILCATMALVQAVSGVFVARSYIERVTVEFGSKLASIAATSALSIDAETHERLAKTGEKMDVDYESIRSLLFRVKQVNEAQGVYDIYTMSRTEDPDYWMFVVEVDESDAAADFREKYDISTYAEMKKALNGPVAESEISKDKFGHWLSAYAPIYSKTGKAVGIVGIDASAESIYQLREKIVLRVMALMIVGMLLSLPVSWFASGTIEGPVRSLVGATEEVGKGNLDCRVEVPDIKEFRILANAFNHMLTGLKERDFIKSTFSRYVSREVVDKIMGTATDEIMKGERRNVTVLFTDLRQFTAMAETMRAEEVLSVLNEHFSLLIDALFEYEGTLDKFTGDGLMAMFGTPVMHVDDPERAVRAALEMQARMRTFNLTRVEKGLPSLQVGIGINTGTVVAGGVGSDRRMEYTVIGDTVNAAARIQGFAEGGQVVITQSTYEYVKDMVKVTPIGPVEVKGKKETMSLFVVEGLR